MAVRTEEAFILQKMALLSLNSQVTCPHGSSMEETDEKESQLLRGAYVMLLSIFPVSRLDF